MKVLVLGTTSEENILEKVGISDVFTLRVAIPPLKDDDLRKVGFYNSIMRVHIRSTKKYVVHNYFNFF